MVAIVGIADLPAAIQSDELVPAMVAAANAKAARVAPCFTWDGSDEDQPAPTGDQIAEAKLVLVGAIRRWVESGAGSVQTQQAGPFGLTVDTRQKSSGYRLWPSEIEDLQSICSEGGDSSPAAFTISTTGGSSAHMPWCGLNLGATYCSCGADLTNYTYPLFEGGVLSGDEY